jgi:hypothetical protein
METMYLDLTEETYISSSESSARDPDSNPDSGNESEDTGDRQDWDPHAGMKPSRQDGHASDDELDLEDDLPYGADIEVNGTMVDLMCELGDNDPRDVDWLPPKERQKLEQRVKGMISPISGHRS